MNRWLQGAVGGVVLAAGIFCAGLSGAESPDVARYLVAGRIHVAVVHRQGGGRIAWRDTVSGAGGDVSFQAPSAGLLEFGAGYARELPHVAVVFDPPPWGGDNSRALGVSVD